jgi:hypothetical protein
VECKTAENLLMLVKEVMRKVREEWDVEVIGFTSDASGESRKARKLLKEDPQFSHLVLPDCYAHQVCTLYMRNYFASNAI